MHLPSWTIYLCCLLFHGHHQRKHMIKAQKHATNCKCLKCFIRSLGCCAGFALTFPTNYFRRLQQSSSQCCLGFLDSLKLQLLAAGRMLGAGKNKWQAQERPECMELQISARKHSSKVIAKKATISEQPWRDVRKHQESKVWKYQRGNN